MINVTSMNFCWTLMWSMGKLWMKYETIENEMYDGYLRFQALGEFWDGYQEY